MVTTGTYVDYTLIPYALLAAPKDDSTVKQNSEKGAGEAASAKHLG
jgi:hypothetical protein